jgi:hypothetical protein
MSLDPVLFIAAVFIVMLVLPSSRRPVRNGYQPVGPARSFDETFPPQPTTVRHGIVVKRRELQAPRYSFSAAKHPNPPMFPHYAFRIKCNDELGEGEMDIVIEKNGVNVLAEEGTPVIVTSTRSRLDYSHMCHTIKAA